MLKTYSFLCSSKFQYWIGAMFSQQQARKNPVEIIKPAVFWYFWEFVFVCCCCFERVVQMAYSCIILLQTYTVFSSALNNNGTLHLLHTSELSSFASVLSHRLTDCKECAQHILWHCAY